MVSMIGINSFVSFFGPLLLMTTSLVRVVSGTNNNQEMFNTTSGGTANVITLLNDKPTSSPTDSFNFIGTDKYKRRFFPERIDRSIYPEGILFSYQRVPDCRSTTGRVGCVAVPRSFDSNAPNWAGQIYTKPPSCDKVKRQCKMGIPMSTRNATLLSKLPISINPFKDGTFLSFFDLPDNSNFVSKSIVAADVNNDGMLDIIVGNDKQNNQLLINAGNGSFVEIIDLPGGALGTYSIVAADMNNDGMVDIIVGNEGHENQLLMNADNGSFVNAINLPGGSLDTRSIAIADVNNDGELDIIIGNNKKTNQLLMNAGNGIFTEIIDLPGGESLQTYSIIAADVDNDGRVDIIVGNFRGHNKLLLNKKGGNTLFENDENLLEEGTKETRSIAVADINDDGMVDIVIGNSNQNNQLLLNDGYGKFKIGKDLPGGGLDTQSIALADMDNDGMVDIIVGNEGQENQILINHHDESNFEVTIALPNGIFKTQSIVAADMNNDGMVDVIVGNEERSNQQLVNVVDDGAFEEGNNLPGDDVRSRAIISADVNNDGLLDIIVGNDKAENLLLMSAGNGLFEAPIDLPDTYYNTYDIVAADLNNDGWIDILVGNYNQPNVLLLNLGNGTFGSPKDLPRGLRNTLTRSIIAADINNDRMLDIIIGNEGAANQLLINRGGGNFSDPPIDLPAGAFDTSDNTPIFDTNSIVAADVNNDGMMDIVLGNYLTLKNQVLINKGNGTFDDVVDLPGGSIDTTSITVADINNDGVVDILVGNKGQKNQLLINKGNGTFDDVVDLPGGTSSSSFSLAVADVNNDGMLDILVGNYDEQPNQFLPYSPCAGGGARLHSKSWCFRCPTFMGRDIHASACMECHPDYVQQPWSREEQCTFPCALGERNLGEDECSECPDGSFYNSRLERNPSNFSTWKSPRCETCSTGSYVSQNFTALDKCFECAPGTYQPEPGATTCIDCKPGEFQTNFKQDKCNPCAVGGYCDAANKVNGGFTPCPPGTYNDKLGQSNESACQKCPVGTYSSASGVNSTDFCSACPPGTYNDKPGEKQCKACAAGKYQDKWNQTTCDPCQNGKYSDKEGFKECILCPFRLSSMNGSSNCTFCAENFYLNNIGVDKSSSILLHPSKFCVDCPKNASCPVNTTILDMGISPGYWRRSRRTQKLYKCEGKETCIGAPDSTMRPSEIMKNDGLNDTISGIYCKDGHTGPLCGVCVKKNHFLDSVDGQCKQCPSLFLFVLLLASICIAALIVIGISWRFIKMQVISFFNFFSEIGLQAKLKLLVSFYQVISSLQDVYGVKLSNEVIGWANVLDYLSLDILKIFNFPTSCMGTTRQQLLINAAWPYIIIFVGGIVMVAHAVYIIITRNTENRGQITSLIGGTMNDLIKKRMIQLTIIVFYFSLPTVSRGIFNAIKCRSFQADDIRDPKTISYLVSNLKIECNRDENGEYASIFTTFLALATISTLLTPLCFLVLCLFIRESVRTKSITFLADASRFLWDDYEPSMVFWDVLDTFRKICLTGFIMLFDIDEGSNKMLRLVVAILVSVTYHTVLLVFRPYKHSDDYNLAFLSNFLLICCFTSGIVLKLCDEEDEIGSCSRFMSKSLNSLNASILVITLAFGMTFFTSFLIVILAVNKLRKPQVLMKLTGNPPNLELSEDCSFHLFMSHVWATGQAVTHNIVRTLQLNLPGLNIWLDVDELYDISKLEESVDSSAVFGLFYSTGYFGSRNCRREIYAAIKLEKPIMILYIGDDTVIDEMKQECITHCKGDGISEPDGGYVLQKLFGDDQTFVPDPIQWLDEGAFSAATMKRIYNKVFNHLPYYQKNKKQLSGGIRVPREMDQHLTMASRINILVYEKNQGCLAVAEELQRMANNENPNAISIIDAQLFVDSERIEDQDIQIYDLDPILEPTFFLFYLNANTFKGDNEEQTELIKSCINNPNIQLALVQEKDFSMGGCAFKEFFTVIPQELINPPYKLFNDIAVPLYSHEEYRNVSLSQILLNMGATSKKQERKLGMSIIGSTYRVG